MADASGTSRARWDKTTASSTSWCSDSTGPGTSMAAPATPAWRNDEKSDINLRKQFYFQEVPHAKKESATQSPLYCSSEILPILPRQPAPPCLELAGDRKKQREKLAGEGKKRRDKLHAAVVGELVGRLHAVVAGELARYAAPRSGRPAAVREWEEVGGLEGRSAMCRWEKEIKVAVEKMD
uniref:Uncharacterized protein n=1 Tax=Oryza barthii TaxID=65489 RepID=A0A0D3FJX9_9ORYZ